MTTIAFRNGTVAADTGCTAAGTRGGEFDKLRKNFAGDVAGVCGFAGWAGRFLDWFAAGEHGEPPKIERIEGSTTGKAVVFRASGQIQIFEETGSYFMRADYFALGSGQDVAFGAMFMRATAQEAVAAAINYDEGSWGVIRCLSVGP